VYSVVYRWQTGGAGVSSSKLWLVRVSSLATQINALLTTNDVFADDDHIENIANEAAGYEKWEEYERG